jgi:hypothetical protein
MTNSIGLLFAGKRRKSPEGGKKLPDSSGLPVMLVQERIVIVPRRSSPFPAASRIPSTSFLCHVSRSRCLTPSDYRMSLLSPSFCAMPFNPSANLSFSLREMKFNDGIHSDSLFLSFLLLRSFFLFSCRFLLCSKSIVCLTHIPLESVYCIAMDTYSDDACTHAFMCSNSYPSRRLRCIRVHNQRDGDAEETGIGAPATTSATGTTTTATHATQYTLFPNGIAVLRCWQRKEQ